MQRDFEIEQEKNRKKEEEVREIATTIIRWLRKKKTQVLKKRPFTCMWYNKCMKSINLNCGLK